MVKDHSAREETHCHHCMGYSFVLAARDLLYPIDRITHSMAFVTPVLEHWFEWEQVAMSIIGIDPTTYHT